MNQIDLGHKEAFGKGFGNSGGARYDLPGDLTVDICSWSLNRVPHSFEQETEIARGTFADDTSMVAFRPKRDCRNWVKNRTKGTPGPSTILAYPNFPVSMGQQTDGQVQLVWGRWPNPDGETLYLNLIDEDEATSVSIRINFETDKVGDGYVTYKSGQSGGKRFVNYYRKDV